MHNRIATYASINPEGSTALVAVAGGGNLINEFARLKFNIDAVELDRRVESTARRYMFG